MSTKPSMRTRLRPLELVVMAALVGVFVGAIVMLGTREWLTALEWAGLAFVVALVVIATLLIAVTPKADRPDAEQSGAGRGDDEDAPRGH